jgi:hypothetical protein
MKTVPFGKIPRERLLGERTAVGTKAKITSELAL